MDSSSDNTLIIFFLVAFALYSFSRYLKYNLPGSAYLKHKIGRHLMYGKLNPIYQPYLYKNFPVLNQLSEDNRLLFESRVQRFINMKTFLSRGEIKQVTPEMKALIAGSAIQITMGYPEVYFSHFRTIIIYPDMYYSKLTKHYHNGEVNQLGVIVVSWKSFMEGFRDPRDGVNLGYHEMAHALKLQNIVENNDYEFFDSLIMNQFEKEAIKEMQKVKDIPAGASFFREYSATNLNEFFAVAIENYIERPTELKAYNIKLYHLLSKILNFDLLEISPYSS
ncbi:MAG: DgsA anti-repressor MtfA [Bacteroidales bacterium]|nr:MAG: DgsA anti-repressor MtfA [Bacteroidales bacterium]